jgi:hypothetical protein
VTEGVARTGLLGGGREGEAHVMPAETERVVQRISPPPIYRDSSLALAHIVTSPSHPRHYDRQITECVTSDVSLISKSPLPAPSGSLGCRLCNCHPSLGPHTGGVLDVASLDHPAVGDVTFQQGEHRLGRGGGLHHPPGSS